MKTRKKFTYEDYEKYIDYATSMREGVMNLLVENILQKNFSVTLIINHLGN